jgi:hypothetical protein
MAVVQIVIGIYYSTASAVVMDATANGC